MRNIFLSEWAAFVQAGMFATRFPLQRVHPTMAESRHFVVYLPIWGAIFAGLSAIIAFGLFSQGLPWQIAAGVMLMLGILCTGALHEDGLADCCDGFWGGNTPEARYAIMKDPTVGSYGVLGLIFSVCFRWIALTSLDPIAACWIFIVIHILPRGLLGILWARLPLWEGQSLTNNRPGFIRAYFSALIAMLFVVVIYIWFCSFELSEWQFSVWIVLSILSILGCAMLGVRKLRGLNGDCFGAAEQVGQISLLMIVLMLR